MLATIALLLLLSSEEPGAPPSQAQADLVAGDRQQVLAEARAALERAMAAEEKGDAETARHEVQIVVELLAPLPLGEGQDETGVLLWNAGMAADRMGFDALAREPLQRVLDHHERTRPEDHPYLILARNVLARTLYELGDVAPALALGEEGLAGMERTRPEDDPELLIARVNVAQMRNAMGDFVGARALREKVLAAKERTLPEDHPGLLRARSDLAMTLHDMGDLAGARALGEAVLAAYERTLPEDHPAVLIARINLAETMASMGDLRGARALQESVLAARERALPEDHTDLLTVRNNLAVTLHKMGDLAGARALKEAVLAARERTLPADHPDVQAARGNLSVALSAMGDLEGARALDESVVAACERVYPEDHPALLWARHNLAATLHDMGDLFGARALVEAVLAARERTLPEDHPDLLAARSGLAVMMKAMGDLPGARALQESVLAARERTLPSDHPDLLNARGNLAVTMSGMGDRTGARALQEAVLAERERTLPEDHPSLLQARGDLARTMEAMGDFPGARKIQEAVIAALERIYEEDHPELLRARSDLAFTMVQMGDFPGACQLMKELIATRERSYPDGHPDQHRDRAQLASWMVGMGDLQDARVLGRDLASDLFRRLEHVSVLSPREAREAVRTEAPLHAFLRFLTESPEFEPRSIRFDLAESLRAASAPSVGATRVDPARRGEVSALRALLNDLVSGGPREGQSSESFAAEVSRLTFERDRLEREMRGQLAAEGVLVETVTSDGVARALRANAAAVGFVRHEKLVLDPQTSMILPGGDVLAAHVLLPDGSLTEFELGAANELAELAGDWRAALGKPIERGFVSEEREVDRERETGDALRARVLDPILAALPEGTTSLHVCVDDFLHLVPLGALPIGEEERVRDRYAIQVEVSFARISSERHPVEGEDVPALLAMGGVRFSAKSGSGSPAARPATERGDRSARPDTFAPLLQTRFEVESVWVLFDEEVEGEAVLLTKREATKAAFHENAPGKRYVHVATHGWFAPETMKSTLDSGSESDALWSRTGAQEAITGLAPMTLCGLAFAGANNGRDSLGRVPGILTAEELAGIDLSGCELAVLSACETNVGLRRAGQGIQSLQTALHAAGARTAITSLWKVDDAATRKLMERFYTYLWVDELGKADALWKAKCDLREEGHPVRDWAAWVLSGDPE